MATDNDKNFDAMMSTLFECADMNTEDLEEFADEYLARLRADAERWRTLCDTIIGSNHVSIMDGPGSRKTRKTPGK